MLIESFVLEIASLRAENNYLKKRMHGLSLMDKRCYRCGMYGHLERACCAPTRDTNVNWRSPPNLPSVSPLTPEATPPPLPEELWDTTAADAHETSLPIHQPHPSQPSQYVPLSSPPPVINQGTWSEVAGSSGEEWNPEECGSDDGDDEFSESPTTDDDEQECSDYADASSDECNPTGDGRNDCVSVPTYRHDTTQQPCTKTEDNELVKLVDSVSKIDATTLNNFNNFLMSIDFTAALNAMPKPSGDT